MPPRAGPGGELRVVARGIAAFEPLRDPLLKPGGAVVAGARGDERVRELVAQDPQQSRARPVEALHGNADRAVVPAIGPIGRASVTDARGHLEGDLHRRFGMEAEPRRVLGVGLGQGRHDRGAEGLVDPAVVLQPELRLGKRRRTIGAWGSGRRADLALHRWVRAEEQALAPVGLGRGAVPEARHGVPENVPGPRVAIVLLQGLFDVLPPRERVSERYPSLGHRLECLDRVRIALQGFGRGAHGFRRIHRQKLPRALGVGVAHWRRGQALVDVLHQALRHAVDPAVLLVTHLVAFDPGPLGLDHPAVLQGDGVGVGEHAAEGKGQSRRGDPATGGQRRPQRSSVVVLTTLGVAPFCRK